MASVFKYLLACLLCVQWLWLSGCSDPDSTTSEATSEETPAPAPVVPDIQTLDLAGMKESGYIRFLVPRFDGLDALPRDGLPVLDYQSVATRFAESLNLKTHWVFVDEFAEMIPALNEGRGDIIVTNMTATRSRAEQVAFSRQIAQVSEMLIARKDNPLTSLDELAEGSITLVKGTAYAETLEQQEFAGQIDWYEGANPIDVLGEVVNGKREATVLDSDVARVILPLYPELAAKFPISRHRPIAWALRKDNPDLLLKLNEFLVAHHVQAAANQPEQRDWKDIKASGRLRMLTLNNPASYFMWRGELMGFDYELMEAFAKENNLHLAVVLKHSIPELFEALKNGEGDLIASSMTATPEREAMGIRFSRPYLYVSEQVVGREDGPELSGLGDLVQHRVVVNPNTVFYGRLEKLFSAPPEAPADADASQEVAEEVETPIEPPAAQVSDATTELPIAAPSAELPAAELPAADLPSDELASNDVSPVADSEEISAPKVGELLAVEATTETLVSDVLAGKYDFTVADSHLAAVESSYHPGLITPLTLTDEAPIAWGVRPDQPQLTEQLNAFIKREYRGLFYNVTFNKYFKNKRSIRRYQSGRIQKGGELSPYDALVQAQAERYGMDWRMLVSQMYQESKFNPKAVSFAGAEGLMQVMPRTAREMGYKDLFSPENGIAAGAAYMDWLEDRFPGELDVQERLYFTLAAYNAGTGHVRDARKLAARLGYDHMRWFGNVEKAMLKLSQPKYYKNARFGYVRGSEPVAYVREIRDRYLGYLASQPGQEVAAIDAGQNTTQSVQ